MEHGNIDVVEGVDASFVSVERDTSLLDANTFSSPAGALLLQRKAEQQAIRRAMEQNLDAIDANDAEEDVKDASFVSVDAQSEGGDDQLEGDIFSSPAGTMLRQRKAEQQVMRRRLHESKLTSHIYGMTHDVPMGLTVEEEEDIDTDALNISGNPFSSPQERH